MLSSSRGEVIFEDLEASNQGVELRRQSHDIQKVL